MILIKSYILIIALTGLSGCVSYHSKILKNNDSINRLTHLDKNKLIENAAWVINFKSATNAAISAWV